MKKFKNQIRILMISNLLAWSIILFFVLTGFITGKKEKFTEIDAERINIVGENGKPVMVLANKRLIPGPSMNGKTYPREVSDGREMLSGIIFFNEQGDEVGGLIYNGIPKDSGYSALAHLSFDQWKQNQVVALQYLDNSKTRRAGLRIWDRPTDVPMDKELDRLLLFRNAGNDQRLKDSLRKEFQMARERGDNGVERLFIGSQDEVAQVQLRDKKGRIKAKLYVDPTGAAKLQFLDEQGKIISELPSR
jgi:hypothetical protein